ncbi:MAG: hypothetical protein PVG39_26725 [Desulfobacteraceae bacterium]|jgi:hypothetical protein
MAERGNKTCDSGDMMGHQKLRYGFILFSLIVLLWTENTVCSKNTDHMLSFKRQTITDSQGFGYDVFNILVPEDWKFSGQVQWSSIMGLPQSYLTYQASSSDGLARVQRYPEQSFNWSENPEIVNGYRMNGAATAPPMGAEDFIRQLFLPSIGKPRAQVLKTTPMPKLAEQNKKMQEMLLLQIYQPISPLPTVPLLDAEAALVETQCEGINEQFLVILHRIYSSQPSVFGTIQSVSWIAEVTSYRAPASDNDTYGPAFQIMLRSAQISPRWAVDCTRLSAYSARDMLRTQQQIHSRMRQIGQSQSEVSDMIMDGWEKRNKIMDGVHDRFSDYMRSSERYHDPIQDMEVDVPNIYENAWTNGSEYVFCDNPNFNPNQTGSTQNWTQMERVR